MVTTAGLSPTALLLLDFTRALPRPHDADTVTITSAVASRMLNADDAALSALYELGSKQLAVATDRGYTIGTKVLDRFEGDRPVLAVETVNAMLQRVAQHQLYELARAVVTVEPGKERWTGIDEDRLKPFDDKRTAQDWFLADRRSIMATHALCAERGWHELTVQLADALWVMLRRTGLTADLLQVQRRAAEAAPNIRHGYGSIAHSRIGWASPEPWQARDALWHCTEAVELASFSDNPLAALATALSTRSSVYCRLGEFKEARGDIERSIEANRVLQSPFWVLGLRMRRLTVCLEGLALQAEALAASMDAIRLLSSDPLRGAETARAYHDRGDMCMRMGLVDEGIQALSESLRLYRADFHPMHEADVLVSLGKASTRMGCHAEAADEYEAARVLYLANGHPEKAAAVETLARTS